MIVVSDHAINQHFKRFGGKVSEEKRLGKANKIRAEFINGYHKLHGALR